MKFKFKNIKNYAIVALASLALASCSNDNLLDDAPSLKAEGMATAPQGILPGVQPANGAWVASSFTKSFSGYYGAKGNSANLPSTITLNQGIGVQYCPGGRAFNGYYYTLNNMSTGKRGIRKMRASGTNLSDVGFIHADGNYQGGLREQDDEVNFTLFDATHGYFTDVQGYDSGVIKMFNPSNMQVTASWNVYAGVKSKMDVLNPAYGSAFDQSGHKNIGGKLLIRRGNYLYADVTFGNDRNQLKQVKPIVNSVFVAVINVSGNNPVVEKILEGTDATNIGLFNDHPLVNIDPITNAIYFATVADMDKTYNGNAGKFSKIFKIADSGNAVPNSMQSVVSYAQAKNNNGHEGEFNTLYVYNSIIYTKLADRTVRYGTFGWHGQHYRESIWQYYMIPVGNVNGKSEINNIPKDNFYAYQQPQLINGKIYMISNNDSGSKVYSITPGSTNATVVTTGVAGGFGLGWAYPDKISSIVKL